MKVLKIILILLLAVPIPAFCVEVAPRISDREIVERLSRLEVGQKSMEKRMEEGHNAINKRFDDINRRFDDINRRFDTITWILGLFVSISTIILGFVVRMWLKMSERQTQLEKNWETYKNTLKTQQDEINFLKDLLKSFISKQSPPQKLNI